MHALLSPPGEYLPTSHPTQQSLFENDAVFDTILIDGQKLEEQEIIIPQIE
jgi:hypothetical protein